MNNYLSEDTKRNAFELFLGRNPNSQEWSELSLRINNFTDLREYLKYKSSLLYESDIHTLSETVVSELDVVIAYWLYLSRHPESLSTISSRIASGQSRYGLLQALGNSDEYKQNLGRHADVKFSSISKEPKFIFLHIPKCAGTSFDEYCTIGFGSGVYFDNIGYRFNPEAIADKIIIGGHKEISLYDNLKSDPIYITILRDPIDRAISLYNYYAKLAEEQEADLPGFDIDAPYKTMLYSKASNQYSNNVQCRFVSGSERYQDALYSIHQNNFIVATVKTLPELTRHLANNYGFSKNDLPELNRAESKYVKDFKKKNRELIQLLTRLNKEDSLLYKHISKHKIIDTVSFTKRQRLMDESNDSCSRKQ